MLRLVVILAALFLAPVANRSASLTASPAPDQCAEINTLLGGETIPWLDDGSGYGYWDLPSDLKKAARIDFAEGGLWLFTAESEPGAKFIWWFFTYDVTTDINGGHAGMHDFCALKVAADG